MAASLAQVTADALALSREEREQLAESLWVSVASETDDAPLSKAWVEEIERRIAEIDNGAETFAAEDVIAELRREFR